MEKSLVRDSPEVLYCGLEQDTLFSVSYWFNQGSKTAKCDESKLITLNYSDKMRSFGLCDYLKETSVFPLRVKPVCMTIEGSNT